MHVSTQYIIIASKFLTIIQLVNHRLFAILACPNGCPNRNSPCAQRNPANGDIPVYDLIREFRLDEWSSRYEAVSGIQGSLATQRAYRLEQSSNLTINTVEVFPRGRSPEILAY